ncbi:hypothetical protein GCM10007148_08460 [Parvularcula lutaonensis]|nr:hypothetical protein GCM10007148_08460 [Parvularcula lutaonensis]
MDPRLAADWGELAGPEIAPLCRPVRIINRGRSQALEVSVKSGAAAMKLRYHQEAILGRVRQKVGLPRLNSIVIREGNSGRGWENRRMAPAQKEAMKPPPSPRSGFLKSALETMRQTIHKDGS